MQHNPHPLELILKRLFDGTADEKDKEQFSGWLAGLDVAEQQLSPEQIEQGRLRLQQEFHKKYPAPVPGEPVVKTAKIRRLLPYLAAATLIIIAGIGWWFNTHQQNIKVAYAQISTDASQRKVVTLADGSRIILNYNSRLRYPQQFSTNRREVFLEGQAFFEVRHEPKRSFIVQNGTMRVQVLGTSFDVTGYAADPLSQVTVSTGKVAVKTPAMKDSWMLTPGQQVIYNKSNGTVTRTKVNTTEFTSWQSGQLVFSKQPLELICQRLERDYRVQIHIETGKLKSKRLSIEASNESLENVLKILSIAGGFKYGIKDNQITIW